MGIVIYGNKEVAIGFNEFLIKCPSCETHSWADVMVLSKYYHMYWIPMFPYEKEANVICKKCGLKRFGRSFDSSLISNFQEVKTQFRHPWFTYIGAGTLCLFFVSVVLAALV